MPAPGYKLITCDYSQAELRILAQLSEDPAFVEAFQSGGDLHRLTASQMFQVPPDLVDKKQRGAAKVINFGLAYGRGPAALGIQLGVSTEEARRLIDQYFKAYAGIQRWLEKAGRKQCAKASASRSWAASALSAAGSTTLSTTRSGRASSARARIRPSRAAYRAMFVFTSKCLVMYRLAVYATARYQYGMSRQFVDAAVMASGPKQLVRVTLWAGIIECSPDHRFLICDPNGRFMWKTPV